MKALRLFMLLLFLAVASRAEAQQRDSHVGYVYPAGGRQGTSFQVILGGQYLANATAVFVSGAGVTATIAEQEQQLSPKEQADLRDKLAKLQEKRKQGQKLTPEEVKEAEDIMKKLANFGRRLANPSLGEFVTLQVNVSANAEPGDREIRLASQFGLSNPVLFSVGRLAEFTKKDWKAIPQTKFKTGPDLLLKPTETTVTLPAVLNGQIPPGGVDRYRFPARQGQQLVVATRARELIPYIADAVPGWFQATITLYDAKGRELAYVDDYKFHPDPVLFYKIPADGDYVLEIKDALFRGREDFVYRITAGELPFVTGIFPLGGKVGTQVTATAVGWNLPLDALPLDLRNRTPGVYPLSAGHALNTVSFAADTLPECFEQEPNNTPNTAQLVQLPIIVNGRIDKPGDVDVFRFEGKSGDKVVAEVYARRLDSPLDSYLLVTDAAGKQLAFNDDHEDKGSGLLTHYADSYLAITLPANGSYFVTLGDAQHSGGEAYSYRLRISAPRPDFELRITPASVNVRGGTSVSMAAYALRRDGFAGEITLSLKDAPKGFTLTAARIPGNQDQVKFTLNTPPTAAMEPFDLHVEGRATIQGREVVKTAVPAEDMMQSFAYRHLVPAHEQKVVVMGRFKPKDSAKILSPTPIRLGPGGSARVKVNIGNVAMLFKVEFELVDPPDGISIKPSTAGGGAVEFIIQADAVKVKPGMKGNLIVSYSGEKINTDEAQKGKGANRRIPLGTLPAIPFEIVLP